MSVVIVIPARHASTRYPGKPLVELRGASGQGLSLIRRSWDAALEVLPRLQGCEPEGHICLYVFPRKSCWLCSLNFPSCQGA